MTKQDMCLKNDNNSDNIHYEDILYLNQKLSLEEAI